MEIKPAYDRGTVSTAVIASRPWLAALLGRQPSSPRQNLPRGSDISAQARELRPGASGGRPRDYLAVGREHSRLLFIHVKKNTEGSGKRRTLVPRPWPHDCRLIAILSPRGPAEQQHRPPGTDVPSPPRSLLALQAVPLSSRLGEPCLPRPD